MNKKILLLLSVFLLFKIIVFAQTKKPTASWQFRSINSVGLLNGESGSAFQLQTVNGAACKSWFAGVGLGIDYYRFRTVPLFADFRKEFGKGAGRAFVYADLGIGFSWVTEQQKLGYVSGEKFTNGFYNDLGAGYKLQVGKKNNGLLFSVGYSFKKTSDSYLAYNYWLSFRDLSVDPGRESMHYSLNRISMKIGWTF